MRCDEVRSELAAPTADRDGAAMADHLAGCAACSEWAARAAGLDRIWEATRPAGPSAEAWDAVWAGIAASLPDAAPSASRNGVAPKVLVHPGPMPAPAVPRSRGRGPRFAAVALVGLAQAAAILLALGLAWRTPPRPVGSPKAPDLANRGPAAIRSETAIEVKAEFDASCVMVISFDGKSGRVENRTPPEMNLSADIGMELTNAMESIDNTQVAAR